MAGYSGTPLPARVTDPPDGPQRPEIVHLRARRAGARDVLRNGEAKLVQPFQGFALAVRRVLGLRSRKLLVYVACVDLGG
jgi:hypothetical protein